MEKFEAAVPIAAMPVCFSCRVQVEDFLAPYLSIWVVWHVQQDWLETDPYRPNEILMHIGLGLDSYVSLLVEVGDSPIYHVQVECSSHPLFVCLFGIYDVSTGPKLELTKYLTGLDETLPILQLENADAVHGGDGAETETDHGHCPSLEKL